MKTRTGAMRAAHVLGSLACAALLGACGGSDDPAAVGAGAASPLVDDHGLAMPSLPSAMPRDGGGRALLARHATPAQAAWLEDALGGAVVRVAVDCCDAAAVERAVGIARTDHAARGLPADAPFVVAGDDPRVAERVAEAGMSRVWLLSAR